MRIITLFFVLCNIIFSKTYSQVYPTFGNEINVIITGLTFDAMEPFISADGNYLFFNSLNDGNTTSLYYATKINDSTFTYVGALAGADQTTTPRLDAVPSSDSVNDFFWVSTRNYPSQFDNYFHGSFNGTNVINIGRLHGTFYIYTPGWLIMDAAINYSGSLLYYCNAYFNNCTGGIPCQAKLGIAQKQNDSTFNKLSNSDGIMENINNTNYLVYAPDVTKDGLEFYYTRILISNPTQTEICVSVRTTVTDTFSLPAVIYTSSMIPEAPTLTTDKLKMYYHKKSGSIYKIFLRYRTSATGINEVIPAMKLSVYPNPSKNIMNVNLPNQNQKYSIEVYSVFGQQLIKTSEKTIIDISNLANGIYFLTVKQEDKIWTTKIMKQ